MTSPDPFRKLVGRAAKWLSLNALVLLALAALPVVLSADLYTGQWLESLNVQPKLHEYCRAHACALDPALVSTSYVLQGAYSLMWVIIGGTISARSSNISRNVKIKGIISISAISIIALFDDADVMGRINFFSNLVHRNPIHLFHPTFPHLIVTSILVSICWSERNQHALLAVQRNRNRV